jgi:tetratricopeptide (TPR) repeat protein
MVKPDFAEELSKLGDACRDNGRQAEAIEHYRRALEHNPDLATAHNHLGNLLRERGEFADAIQHYRRASQIRPDSSEAWSGLGNALREVKLTEEAAQAYRRAIELKPDNAVTHNNLGAALQALDRLDEAAGSFERAIALKPDYANAHNNLGSVLRRQGRLSEAESCFQKALALKPDLAAVHYNLGNVLRDQAQFEKAIACYQRALELNSGLTDSWSGLGSALTEQHLRSAAEKDSPLEGAAACYRRAIQLEQNNAGIHYNLALLLLLMGHWEEGWREYEWRWKTKDYGRLDFPQPRWAGEPLAGKTILIYSEQGLGDTLQFVRYAPLVQERGGRVILVCQPQLRSLLSRSPGIDLLLENGECPPVFDLQIPLLSLPGLLQTTTTSTPATIPYVFADPVTVQSWAEYFARFPELKVAIAWRGNVTHKSDRYRSIPPPSLQPLSKISGIRLFSVQKDATEKELGLIAADSPIIDLGYLDLAATAAVMMHMDLIVSCDTSIAHLAGALGRPVWLALSCTPDWRWLLHRQDTPWYPTMRIFRQSAVGAWTPVLEIMAQQLEHATTRPNWQGLQVSAQPSPRIKKS